jgi:hypothetical protein
MKRKPDSFIDPLGWKEELEVNIHRSMIFIKDYGSLLNSLFNVDFIIASSQ